MNYGIAININNNPKVLNLIVESLPYLHNRWKKGDNVKAILSYKKQWYKSFPNATPKYYIFNLSKHEFSYMMEDTDKNEERLPINEVFTISQASELMDYVYEVDSTGNYKDSPDGKWKICSPDWF